MPCWRNLNSVSCQLLTCSPSSKYIPAVQSNRDTMLHRLIYTTNSNGCCLYTHQLSSVTTRVWRHSFFNNRFPAFLYYPRNCLIVFHFAAVKVWTKFHDTVTPLRRRVRHKFTDFARWCNISLNGLKCCNVWLQFASLWRSIGSMNWQMETKGQLISELIHIRHVRD